MTDYQHWQLEVDHNTLWLKFARADTRVNTLNETALNELDDILSHIEHSNDYRSVIIYADHSQGFIAGADLHELGQKRDQQAIANVLQKGQQVFERLGHLPVPVVAMIDGYCLGGGLELALACHYRVVERESTLGLPEIKLGVHPGWGGTVRLPKLIGPMCAMKLMLSGNTISAGHAKKLTLVDAAVPRRQLKRAAEYYARNKPRVERPRLRTWLTWLGNSRAMRPVLAWLFKRQTSKKVQKDHYPAPFQLIDNWSELGVGHAAFKRERESFGQLAQTQAGRNLMRAFFLREKLKQQGKQQKARIEHVHVIGAGVMGGDIAAWAALCGFRVTLQDQAPEYIAPAIKNAHTMFERQLKTDHAVQSAFDRMVPDPSGHGVARADVVIEAISEKLEAKQNLFRQLEQQAPEHAILATNTSSLTLEAIAEGMAQPHRLIGLHFFNPVAKMLLVEVVQGEQSQRDLVEKGLNLTGRLSRLPLAVKSSPGFLINRLLFPYLLEGINLYEQDVKTGAIDQAAEEFGMPMGPLKLADYVGLDILLHGLQTQSAHTGIEPPEALTKLVEKKRLGKKSGRGFYRWRKGRVTSRNNKDQSSTETVERLIYPVLDAAVRSFYEGIVDEPDLLDAGMIFGTGFAPFRGGPFQYLRDVGPKKVYDRLNQFADQYGERFRPDEASWADWLA